MPLPPTEAEPCQAALLQVLRTSDIIWNASQTFFERWKLGPSQFNVLNVLRLNPGGLSQTDLSRLLVMHRSNLTGLVDRLEHRGLVSREGTSDRRAYRVVLTPAGAKLLTEILPGYFDGIRRLWQGMPARRMKQLVKDLEDLATRAGEIATEIKKASRKSTS